MQTIGPRSLSIMSGAIVLLGLAACGGGSSSSGVAASTRATGIVSEAGGAALDEYVTLVFTLASTGAATSTQTDTSGAYSVALEPGSYDLVVARPGFEDYAQSAVAVVTGGATALNVALTALAHNVYIGSIQCGVCHEDLYQTFRQTGHPFKLNEVNGAAPTYPFTDLAGIEQRIGDDDTKPGDPHAGTDNSLGTPGGWGDISYVVGGFNWKARFLDANGFVVTGSEVQYNYATDAMVAYHDNEVDKAFNCGNCHTTGWQHYDPIVNNNRQGGLPGMHGTFAESGVGCESCHGAGSTHARTTDPADVTRVASPRQTADFLDGTFAHGQAVDCSDCHTRDGERDYPSFLSAFDTARMNAGKPVLAAGGRIAAKGGLVRHHEQFDETLGIDPDTLDSTRTSAFMLVHGNCQICHDPHKAVVARANPSVTEVGVDSSNANCYRCHAQSQYDPANNLRPQGSMKALNCVDCHMPKNAKSATSRMQANGVPEGDVTSHVFGINIYGPQFTGNGKFSYPYLGFDFACRQCHGDETFDILAPPVSFNYHPDN